MLLFLFDACRIVGMDATELYDGTDRWLCDRPGRCERCLTWRWWLRDDQRHEGDFYAKILSNILADPDRSEDQNRALISRFVHNLHPLAGEAFAVADIPGK
tara:strand:- start:597 stop:899 length:303 start_codon:yes stop_codon:yes gene_type:complete